MGRQKDSRDGEVDGWVDCYASLKRKGEEYLDLQHTFVKVTLQWSAHDI